MKNKAVKTKKIWHHYGKPLLFLMGMIGFPFGICVFPLKAASIDSSRTHYEAAIQALEMGQQQLAEKHIALIKNYPLYPYLKYHQLNQNLSQVNANAIKTLIQQYPNLPIMRTLSGRFIDELARRQDWEGVLSFSPELPATIEGHCYWHYAQWKVGNKNALNGVEKIWLKGTSLPKACDPLFSLWKTANKQTPALTKERIILALKAGNPSLAMTLAKQLPETEAPLSKALIKLVNHPQFLDAFTREIPVSDFTQQVTLFTFPRLARVDVTQAQALIPILVKQHNLKDKKMPEEVVAQRLINESTTQAQSDWRDRVIKNSASVSLIEQRIRLALLTKNPQEINEWIAILPPDAQKKDDWQYWKAESLINNGEKIDGKKILQQLKQKRGFYPMVAAYKLGIPYSLKSQSHGLLTDNLKNIPELLRIKELIYWGMDDDALSEWQTLLVKNSPAEQEKLAYYAGKQGWWALSIQATITAKLWDHLHERFPVAFQETFKKHLQNKRIPKSFAMAVARQESAWYRFAKSSAGALGLMQLMPATAKDIAKKYAISDYTDASVLYDPELNIQIGTQYLEDVFQTFGNNRILAAAAYNAGPKRVKTWLKSRDQPLDVLTFIETLPYLETRGYVKNVLAYDAYYRYFLKRPGKIFSDEEWNRVY